jgi:hypothetical protein
VSSLRIQCAGSGGAHVRLGSVALVVALASGFTAGCTGVIDGTTAPPQGAAGSSAGSGATPAGQGGSVAAGQGGSGGVGSTAGLAGESGASSAGTGGSVDMPTPDSEGNLPYEPPAALPPELRARTFRLSHAEYQKTVQSFLGVPVDVSDLEPEIDNGVYPNMSGSGFVRVTLATEYYAKAETLSDSLSDTALAALVPGGALQASSRDAFLAAALERAFRRPAAAEEIAAYGEIFDLAAAAGDPELPFRAVVRALLTSPNFLYRTEIGTDAAAPSFTLTDYEVASLLSYSLLGSPPSETLLAAAARGELTNFATLPAVVDSLLNDPAATAQLAKFTNEWLKLHHFDEVEKDEGIFPEFPEIRDAMLAESRSFLDQTAGPSGTLSALLTTTVPPPAGALGAFYASEPSGGGSLGARMGVLSLAAPLAARSKPNVTSPTLRGLFVRERFLCQSIHLPADQPPDISETEMAAMPRTTRELYELHASEPACRGCHTLIDPVGFVFENLDAAGRFRTMEDGTAIDTSGELLNSDVNRPLTNHTDLAVALAESEWVRECLATQVFRFYFGQVEAGRGLPPVQAARLAAAAGTFRSMIAASLGTQSTIARIRN